MKNLLLKVLFTTVCLLPFFPVHAHLPVVNPRAPITVVARVKLMIMAQKSMANVPGVAKVKDATVQVLRLASKPMQVDSSVTKIGQKYRLPF